MKELVGLVRKYASAAKSTVPSNPMDLAKKIPYFTLDVISHVGLGEPFGDLKADEDIKDYLKSIEEGLKIGNTAFAMGVVWLKDMPIIGPLISPSEKDTTGLGRMMAEARKIVDARRLRSMKDQSDMLASFVRNGVTGDDLCELVERAGVVVLSLTPSSIVQEAFEQIIAGSDTTAAAIRIILLYIMSHPRVYTALRAEIDGAVQSGTAPASPDVVSDAEARRLPYLSAVVREGLRVSCHALS